jgi:hypothetical protein
MDADRPFIRGDPRDQRLFTEPRILDPHPAANLTLPGTPQSVYNLV